MSKYNPETPEEIAARIADLKTKRTGRQGRSEFKVNLPEIKAEIARLEAL